MGDFSINKVMATFSYFYISFINGRFIRRIFSIIIKFPSTRPNDIQKSNKYPKPKYTKKIKYITLFTDFFSNVFKFLDTLRLRALRYTYTKHKHYGTNAQHRSWPRKIIFF